jgi:uncharacterized protein (TIGR03435 family)
MLERIITAVLMLFSCTEVFAQAPNVLPSFEVVSIKPSAPMPAVFMPGSRLVCPLSGCGGPGTSDPGLLRFADISLRSLIQTAYSVMPNQMEAPSWLDSARFDVVATVPQGATREQTKLMLQNLLADRFQLKLHHSTKEIPAYMLVVAKNGPKLKESVDDPNPPSPTGLPPDGGRAKGLGTMFRTGPGGERIIRFAFDGWTIAKFAETLGLQVDRPVIDMTGLKGKYDVRLEFAPDLANSQSTPDLFTALTEQLGLKLEPRKGPVEMLIVDSASKLPTEN